MIMEIKPKILTLVAFAGFLCLTSCIKDEEPNKECDIVNAWVQGDEYLQYFADANQMRKENIGATESDIVFTVRSLVSLPKQLPLSFDVTEGATIEPANGSMQDFTNGPVTYTLTSQDGQYQRQYRVSFVELSLPAYTFSFEHVSESEKAASGSYYHEFYEVGENGQRHDIWASGNPGAALTMNNAKPDAFPTMSMEDGYKGKGVCLKTISTGALGEWLKKPIAAGNLFLGKFVLEQVLVNALKATQMGIQIDRDPVRVTGYYKYRPGEKFTNVEMKEVPGRIDEPNIYAVLYKNKDKDGKEQYLYGDNVLSSPIIVKKAIVKSLPPTDEWTRFEMFFEGDEADPEMMARGEYNLALVFSSSKGGDDFEGAIGSTLCVDEVNVLYEK
jgi:hypothetical protein